MADHRTITQPGNGGGPGNVELTEQGTSEESPPDLRRYLVGFETIRTLDASLPEPGRVIHTAKLDTLGRAAIVELPEAAVPQFVSTAGIEYVLDVDHL
jgi:hypothetical protein